MDKHDLVTFVRDRGLAVVATHGPDATPEAALVGIAATDDGELVFDTSVRSRKYANLAASGRLALVVGWDDEVTVQCEGDADVLDDAELEPYLQCYLDQYPDGVDRAANPDIVLIRVRPDWVRHCDSRPESFGIEESRCR